MIVLRALGTAEIDTGVSKLTPSQEIVFAAALYLILERGKRVSRTQLAAMLWPQVPERARAHRLRQTIFQLKKLGIVVMADRDNVRLSQHDARSDVDDLATSDASGALTRDSLEFLPGYTPRLSEPLRDWVEAKRSDAHAAATTILVHELERSRLQADWPKVEKASAKCLLLDSYNETAVLAQAEAAAMRGSKRKALSILDRYIAEVGVGSGQGDLHLPATLLRRRVVERIPDRPALLNVDPPFVGREAEMEILTRKFNAAREGRGSAILLVGEPGIGKSRLSAEVARFAELQGALVQRSSCRRGDVDRPLSLFVDIVPQVREMPGALGCAPESFTFLKRLTEFEERPQEATHKDDSDMLFQNLRAALFDLFDSVVEERCLLLVIEDVQWLDDASAKILIRMAERCGSQRLFFLLNSRPSTNTIVDYAEKSPWETTVIGPLKSDASMVLLNSVALRPGDRPDVDFVNWCLEVAEGNPFFLQELAHQWIETGRRSEAPPSVTKVLQERLSRLSQEGLQTLQVCAVLGEHSTIDRVEAVLQYRSHQLLSAVEELSRAAMLRSQIDRGDSSDCHLQPRHEFISTAALNRLASLSLAFLHRRSAEILEKEIAHAATPTPLLWACANHREVAGDRKQALVLRLSCAQHLLDVGLAADACRRYEDSLSYCRSDYDKLAVMAPLSVALQTIGEWERTKDVLRTCVRLSSSTTGSNGHSEFEISLFNAQARSSLEFVTLLNEILPCVMSPAAPPPHRVAAAAVALKVASDVGPSEMLDKIYREVEPFLSLGSIDPIARLEVEIIYQTMRGQDTIATEVLDNFCSTSRTLRGDLAYSHALLACASSCRITARDEECNGFIDAAFAHAVSHNLRARIPVVKLSRIRLYAAIGDWPAARKVLATRQDDPIADQDLNTRAEWDFFDARVALEQGDLSSAQSALSEFEVLPGVFSAGRRSACLALALRIRLAASDPMNLIRPLAEGLEAAHTVNQNLGNQDFEAHALFLGLSAIGQKKRAYELLYGYLQNRHSRRPVPRAIRALLRADDMRRKPVRPVLANFVP